MRGHNGINMGTDGLNPQPFQFEPCPVGTEPPTKLNQPPEKSSTAWDSDRGWWSPTSVLIRTLAPRVKDVPVYVFSLDHPYACLNPLRPTVIQKLLGIIGRVRLCPSCSFATALDSDINQTTGSVGHLGMWENWCMHAAVCLLRAGQPRSAGDAAKLGQFIGQFSWVTGNPIGVKGLNIKTTDCVVHMTITKLKSQIELKYRQN